MKHYFMKISILSALMIFGVYGILWLSQAGQENSPLSTLAISHYTHPESAPWWVGDYFAFAAIISFLGANVLLFFVELFFVEPSRAPMSDPTSLTHLMHQSVPPLAHLQDAFYTCPGLDEHTIEAELASQGITTTARAYYSAASWAKHSEEHA